MAVIVEIRRRGGQLIERCRCEAGSITVGRAFDNDIIVDDPFVSAHHLELVPTEAGWQVVDLDSINGYRIKSQGRSVKRDVIQSGEKIRLGQVTLCIYHSHHPVIPAIKVNGMERQLKGLGWHQVWPFVLVAALALLLFDSYLDMVAEVKATTLLGVVVGHLIAIGGIAVLWGVAGRIFRHQSRFFSHLSLWAISTVLAVFADNLAYSLGYNVGSDGLALVTGSLLNFVLLAVVIWASLSLASNIRPNRRVWSAVGVSLLFLLLDSFDVLRFQPEFSSVPDYQGSVRPPAVTWAEGGSEQQLTEQLEKLFDTVEAEAKEELD